MATQPPQYGGPIAPAAVRRSKYLDDAIRGLQQSRDKSVYNTAFGTNASILSDAILAFGKRDADNRAEAATKADNERLTAAIMGTPMDTAKADLGADKPFDLTAGGFAGREQDTNAARMKAIAEIGGPMAALQYQQGQEQQQYARGRDARADFVDDRGFNRGVEVDDRNYNRDVFTDDRNYDRGTFESDRGYDTQVDQFGQGMDLNRDQFEESKRQFDATLAAKRAADEAEAAGSGMPDFGDENSLRSQYLGQAKTFQDIARASSSVRALSPDMNPAEQMSLIFQTMKMLDPTSSVRETEYANAQNTTGAFGQMWNVYNKAKDGTFLDPQQIADFRGMIDGLYKAAEGEYAKTYDFYRGQTARYPGMDPSIIQDFRLAPAEKMPQGLSPTIAGMWNTGTPEMRQRISEWSAGQPPAAPVSQYTPQEVQQAQFALQNFNTLPQALQTPQRRAQLEAVVASARQQRAPAQVAPQTAPDDVSDLLEKYK